MRASLRWLRELVDLPDDVDAIADAFNSLGAEVEEVEHLELPFEGVIVARVLKIDAHPDADKIRVVTVDVGGSESTVVCGAWNFDVGATVALSPPGARLAGGFEVGEKEIRGVVSPGMICSEKELGLGDDGDGILVLGEGEAEPGTPLADLVPLPDVVFDVTITSNRPDLMSHHGLARDLAARFDTEVRAPAVDPVSGTGDASVSVQVDAPDRCPRFTAREIRGVSVGPSPLWMQTRLRAIGVRPVSNVVDITNYVMMELGQPLHAFDLDRIGGASIVVRTAAAGETLTTIDGHERTLREEDLVIADADQPMGLAGVMGGIDSEVTESTTNVVLEVAHFAAGGVMLTGKHYGLRSEAVARFERGVDPALPPVASARATALITEIAGGEVVGDLIDTQPADVEPVVVDFDPAEVERLIGMPVAHDEIVSILQRLGFSVDGKGPLRVTVPTYRPDVTRPADLVEEVARIHGYDQVPERLPMGTGGGLPPAEVIRREARRLLIGAGYYEMISLDFVAPSEITALGFAPEDPRSQPVRVRNPVSDEHGVLRTTLLPGLLGGLRVNASRNRHDVALFEIGAVFLPFDGEVPHQPHHLGFVAMGRGPGVSWQETPPRDALDATGLAATLLDAFGVAYELSPAALPALHPGRSAEIVVGGVGVGFVGEVHPATAAAWDLDGRIAVGEIDLSALAGGERSPFAAPSALPPVVFDLAFDVGRDIPAAALVAAVREAAGEWLERAVVFDVFDGAPLEAGRRSIAIRLTFRDPERTLSDEDLVPVREAITRGAEKAVGARLRGG